MFILNSDMPVAAYSANHNANVAPSLAQVSIGRSSTSPSVSMAGLGVLSGTERGKYGVPGLNELLDALLPDANVLFPAYMFGRNCEVENQQQQEGGTGEGARFNVLNGGNEEWWATLMDAAFIGDESQQQQILTDKW